MSEDYKFSEISIKKHYFTNERWDVMATGLNRAFRDLKLSVRAKAFEETDDHRGTCVVIRIDKEEEING